MHLLCSNHKCHFEQTSLLHKGKLKWGLGLCTSSLVYLKEVISCCNSLSRIKGKFRSKLILIFDTKTVASKLSFFSFQKTKQNNNFNHNHCNHNPTLKLYNSSVISNSNKPCTNSSLTAKNLTKPFSFPFAFKAWCNTNKEDSAPCSTYRDYNVCNLSKPQNITAFLQDWRGLTSLSAAFGKECQHVGVKLRFRRANSCRHVVPPPQQQILSPCLLFFFF